jgi:phage protein D
MPDNENLFTGLSVKMTSEDMAVKFKRDLLEVTIENSLHLPDMATFVLQDAGLSWVDDPKLLQGVSIEVSAKTSVKATEEKIFDGEIVEIEPSFIPGKQRLIVRAFDRMHRLQRGRKVRSFVNETDRALVTKLAQEVGLEAKVGPTPQIYPYIFQNNETNLAFLQRRAASLGYLLFVRDKTLHCEAPQKEKTVQLKWGATLREFYPRLTPIEQVDKVTVRGWDPAKKQPIFGQANRGSYAPTIGLSSKGNKLAKKAFKLETEALVAERPIRTEQEATRVAEATLNQLDGRFIEAEGTCSGDPHLVAGASVEITEVGTHFSGTYFVTSTTHIYSAKESYTTRFSISALHQTTLLGLLTPEEPTGPPMGLCIGIVTDNNDDEGLGRVKVKYPWLSNKHASDWARVIAPGGGAKRGIEFLPEVNDEVLVGFEMGDVHFPYVLGGLWNGKDALPEKVTSGGKVQKRLIRSRLGHTITLDDSEGGGGITIEDKNGNKVVLDSGANSLTIKAEGSITIDAGKEVTIIGKMINLN